ncbi:MAG: MBL fold metallo-hydrolase, partial [Bradyrhizobiaceae bacterium]|nr:MBL fold metallo-hydrolase [Bradyrhizobiaceae bacterium]
MLKTSRRNLILSAATAGAWLGLDRSLALVLPEQGHRKPAASAQGRHKPATPVRPTKTAKTPDPKPGFLRYKVGDAEITALYDGIWEKAHDGRYFGNAS